MLALICIILTSFECIKEVSVAHQILRRRKQMSNFFFVMHNNKSKRIENKSKPICKTIFWPDRIVLIETESIAPLVYTDIIATVLWNRYGKNLYKIITITLRTFFFVWRKISDIVKQNFSFLPFLIPLETFPLILCNPGDKSYFRFQYFTPNVSFNHQQSSMMIQIYFFWYDFHQKWRKNNPTVFERY